jgi:hypothetical protein
MPGWIPLSGKFSRKNFTADKLENIYWKEEKTKAPPDAGPIVVRIAM